MEQFGKGRSNKKDDQQKPQPEPQPESQPEPQPEPKPEPKPAAKNEAIDSFIKEGEGFDALDMDDAAFKKSFEEMKEKRGEELTGELLDFKSMKPGEIYPFFFTGITSFTDTVTGDQKNAVKLVDENRTTFISPSTLLVGKLIDVTPPKGVKITFLGRKDSKKGQGGYWDMKIHII